jgi:hypothetical protein
MEDILVQVISNKIFAELLYRELPRLRVNRNLRSTADTVVLRNVIWGRECGVCDRSTGRTWTFVVDDLRGHPDLYACLLCHRMIWQRD